MTQLIDHVAEITGFRDRDQLDLSVVCAVADVLKPLAVGIYRSVGVAERQRWLTRARMAAGDSTASADPLWNDIESLPELDAVPARKRCLTDAEPVTVGETPQTNYFPISTERQVIGVLEVQTADPLNPADRAIVTTIVRIYGNFHDLLDHSERDPLTGLLNRQTFNSALVARGHRKAALEAPQSDRREAAEGTALWLAVVDIDHFKRVNDSFGHPIGDEVLLLLSRLLRSTFRHFDRLYRFGGEEFVVVLECLHAEQAQAAFERLRANVERFEFPQVGRVTVSMGFTETVPTDTPSIAFARADKALYHAKEHGRNQVAWYEQLVRAGRIVSNDIVGDVELF